MAQASNCLVPMQVSSALAFSLFALCVSSFADPVRVRIVAANLTSGTEQAYSPSNAAHSNLEGAGARILKGVKPDLILIQEFNTTVTPRQWVNQTFGTNFDFSREEGTGIPNGIVSRYPIIASGEWDDPTQSNRDFAWAKVGLPNGTKLWAVSVHLKSGSSRAEKATRLRQAEVLVAKIRANIPAADHVVLGGDFNTSGRSEAAISKLGEIFHVARPFPEDLDGDEGTNASRRKPYDWVIADAELQRRHVPARAGGEEHPGGVVIDTREFEPLSEIAPAQRSDSGVAGMQHMAVIREFLIP